MATSIEFRSDTTEMQKMVKFFTEKDWKTVKKRTLSKAAAKLKRDAKKSFKLKLPFAADKNPKYNDKMIDAVRSSKVEDKGLAELKVKVHVLGTRKKGSGTFRARFFEGGTQERTMSPYVDSLGRKYVNSRSTGRIHPPLYFFKDTISNLNPTQQQIHQDLEEQINKLNNKKYS